MATDYIQTFTGKSFYPLEPRAEDICIEDIAHALSNICRYTGHCKFFYSVAQHSVLVADILKTQGYSKETQFHGLMHDGTEAYLCDIAKPVKNEIPHYVEHEKKLETLIFDVFKINYDCWDAAVEAVHRADQIALATEIKYLMNNPKWDWPVSAMKGVEVKYQSPVEAKAHFELRYGELKGESLL